MPPSIDLDTAAHWGTLLTRLEKEVPEEHYVPYVKYMITLDYFSQPDHMGGIVTEDVRRYYIDGTCHSIAHIKWVKMLSQAEELLRKYAGEDKRSGAFHRVMKDLPKRKPNPDWERPTVNPNEKPRTEYSAARSPPGEVMSNSQLVDALAEALNMEDTSSRKKDLLRAQIIYTDGHGDYKRPCFMLIEPDQPAQVHGGRLGRDHTLEDVPNHFCRDQIMDYINETVKDELKSTAYSAVFPDLGVEDCVRYASLVAEIRRKAEVIELGEDMESLECSEESEEDAEPWEDQERMDDILRDPNIRTANEAANLYMQQTALDEIEVDNVDLMPNSRATRYHRRAFVVGSVMTPGSRDKLPQEEELLVPSVIDLDCDQVRVMISKFIKGGEWSLDQFRQALGDGIERKKVTAFLQQRGPEDGHRSLTYQLAWEFFKKRELLGLPLTTSATVQETPELIPTTLASPILSPSSPSPSAPSLRSLDANMAGRKHSNDVYDEAEAAPIRRSKRLSGAVEEAEKTPNKRSNKRAI